MNEELHTSEEISLADIFKALMSKLKILILVLLGAAVIGGAVGYVTNVNKKYYGTDLEFYVNPKETVSSDTTSTYGVYGAYGVNVMNTIIELLNSEMFAEDLMESMTDAPEIPANNGAITQEYRNYLKRIINAVEFDFIKEDEKVQDMTNLARSFIYVRISVLGEDNIEFAEQLLAAVKMEVPSFVKENMIVPTGYSRTECTEITKLSTIERTNPNNAISSAITYAMIVGAVALVLACVVVVILDRSDKRLRDYEGLFRKLNIPVLGIVPQITEKAEENKGDEQQ